MDLRKTGKFIAERRKSKKLTQVELAEKLMVSEKTISKWECGNGFPDTTLILPLCEALDITANELLSAKILSDGEYKKEAENNLILLKNKQESTAKFLLILEYVMSLTAVILGIGAIFLVTFLPSPNWLKIVVLVVSLLLICMVCALAIRIEQKAGFYMCKYCKNKYIPSYKAVFLAMHYGTTRYLKCPKCKKHSWSKKVISDE